MGLATERRCDWPRCRRWCGSAAPANHPRHFVAQSAGTHLPGQMILDELPRVIAHPMPLATLPEQLDQMDREIERTVRHTEIPPIDRPQLLADLGAGDHRHARGHWLKHAAVKIKAGLPRGRDHRVIVE